MNYYQYIFNYLILFIPLVAYSGITDGLVAHYTFNGDINDTSGKGSNLTAEYADRLEFVTGRSGAGLAAKFNETEDSLYYETTEAVPSPDGGETMSCWFNLSGSQNEFNKAHLIMNVSAHNAARFEVRAEPIEGGFYLATTHGHDPDTKGFIFEDVPLEIGQWHHVLVATEGNGTVTKVYLNGSKVKEVESGTNTVDNPYYGIGGNWGSDMSIDDWVRQPFLGSIDDVRIYNRALSSTEVTALYELEKSGTPSFEIVSGSFTWEEAKTDAEAKGGRLAVLDTQTNINLAKAYLNGLVTWPYLWLGGSDIAVEDTWVWLNGEIIDPANSNWKSGEGVNNTGDDPDGEDYLLMWPSDEGSNAGLWGDSTRSNSYLIEYPLNEAPFGITLDNNSVLEGQPVGTVVGLFSAIDVNAADSHTFALTDSSRHPDNALFTVEGNQLKAAALFDANSKNSYVIEVEATDFGGLNFKQELSLEISPSVYVTTMDNLTNDPVRVGPVQKGLVLTMTAEIPPGYVFTHWSGDISGTESPVSVTLNEDMTIISNFEQDLGDTDGDGLTNYSEIIVHKTDYNAADTDGDTIPDGKEIELGLLPLVADSALVDYFTSRMGVGGESSGSPYTLGWYYQPGRGWVWTNENSFPMLFDKTLDRWIYFKEGSQAPIYFFDFSQNQWTAFQE